MANIIRLRAIKALAPGQWAEGGAALDEYVKKLTQFTDSYPGKEEELRDALADADKTLIAQIITEIRGMLLDIGADSLAAGCAGKPAEIPSMTAAGLEAYAESLFGAVSALSVDILMAIYGGGEEVTPGTTGSGGRVILAVDDNSFFLNTLKAYLSGTDYKLTCVTSGSVALRFLEKHTPDLCVLDIDMPEMDGYELAGKIREKGVNAPIIFLTGNAAKEYIIKAVSAGAADFIIKPISKEQALEKIGKYI